MEGKPSPTPSNIHKQVLRILEADGIGYRLHVHPEVCTMEQARALVPHLTHNLIKTIVFKIKNGHWILAAVPKEGRIDYKKLSRALGVKRTAMRSIAPGQVTEALGFQVGGVGPFRLREDMLVVVDEQLKGVGRVFCGSGINTQTIEMEMEAIIRISQAVVASITKSQY